MWLDLTSLIPLPVLSLVALPWFTNFSTSLNLLFFYMTWSILILSYPSTQVEIIGTLLFRAVFYLLPAIFFLALDLLLPSLSRNLKADGDDALPGRLGGKRLARVVGVSVFNLLLGIALHAGIELLFIKVLRRKSLIKVTTSIPLPWSVFIDVLWALGVRGLLTYYIHRFVLHAPSKSRYSVSSLHRAWAHSIRQPFSFTSNYDHPLPYLLHRWVPLYLPAYAFHTHLLTFQLLIALTSLEELLVFSGYSAALLPGTTVVNSMARRQDSHYRSAGRGNFGGIGVMDWCHATGVDGTRDVSDDLADEAEKHDLAGKISNAQATAGELVGRAGEKLKGKGRKGARPRGQTSKDE